MSDILQHKDIVPDQSKLYSENSIIRARLIRETVYYELEDMVPIFAYYLLYKMSWIIWGK